MNFQPHLHFLSPQDIKSEHCHQDDPEIQLNTSFSALLQWLNEGGIHNRTQVSQLSSIRPVYSEEVVRINVALQFSLVITSLPV